MNVLIFSIFRLSSKQKNVWKKLQIDRIGLYVQLKLYEQRKQSANETIAKNVNGPFESCLFDFTFFLNDKY